MAKPKQFRLISSWRAMRRSNRISRSAVAIFVMWPVFVAYPEACGQDTAITESAALSSEDSFSDDSPSDVSPPAYFSQRVRGRVVWLNDALKEAFEISTVPEARDRVLAVATDDGKLIPLVENLRGRAFRTDERLRNRSMEIWVRRYQDHPFAQVLRIFEISEGKMFEVDYWCDICAIEMFETGPCSCCQDDNRLRKRPVDPKKLSLND